MGWADCGTDSQGRPIGYAFEATCDHPECNEKIDRGLAYACGDMHGEDVAWCERYFCHNHLTEIIWFDGHYITICEGCGNALKDSGDWIYDEEEGVFVEGQEYEQFKRHVEEAKP